MNDESWDYYLATGEDPTGGRIGPDFDPETGEYVESEETVTAHKVRTTSFSFWRWIKSILAK